MKIKIFTTGGTVDKTYFDTLSEYKVGEPQIKEILNIANVGVAYEIESLLLKDSLDLTEKDRALIHSSVANEDRKHILITHGTDTMALTAKSLEDIPGKTIVLVGSLCPARFKNSDAEFNIGYALAAVQILPPGVYITMNGQVFNSGHVRKNRLENKFEEA